jgi:hypothetical protein
MLTSMDVVISSSHKIVLKSAYVRYCSTLDLIGQGQYRRRILLQLTYIQPFPQSIAFILGRPVSVYFIAALQPGKCS